MSCSRVAFQIQRVVRFRRCPPGPTPALVRSGGFEREVINDVTLTMLDTRLG